MPRDSFARPYSKEVEKIRKELAKVDALKEALGLKKGSDRETFGDGRSIS